jgi:hypothetical protein
VEEELARIAEVAHGIVTRQEMLAAGITRAEIKFRVGTGALIREYTAVYRVGHRAPSLEARYLAAVKACGAGARLGDEAAGYLLGLLKGRTPPPTVVTLTDRSVTGVWTRRARRSDLGEPLVWRGIPVTSVADTLVDLARLLDADDLARACHEAGVRHETTPRDVEAALARRRRTPTGVAKLRAVLQGEAPVTLSVLERRFLALLREAGLPLPQTNKPAGTKRVDCRWPDLKLTVELDSYRFHNSRYSWEQDRRREREARSGGGRISPLQLRRRLRSAGTHARRTARSTQNASGLRVVSRP